MKVNIIHTHSSKTKEATIQITTFRDMPKVKDGWNFNWRKLFKTEGAEIYKLTIEENETEIEGIVMLTLMNEEMLYMNNIEIAPHNYGANGKYENIAGCLIAFACLKSMELGKNTYEGYLTFESKTVLIDLYKNKYGATSAMGQRMFIAPDAGEKLINKYLEIQI